MNKESFLSYQTYYESYLQDDPEKREKAAPEVQRRALEYTMPENMTMEDRTIEGHPEGKAELPIRIYRPERAEPLPVILDIHGGAWMFGGIGMDVQRCIELATRVPAIVISVDYTLSDGKEHHFPAPLMDILQLYTWTKDHAGEFGGAPDRIGLYGYSAGGNLAEGLALYLRDHGDDSLRLVALDCHCLYMDKESTYAYHQNFELRMGAMHLGVDPFSQSAEMAYLKELNGQQPSYYAFPGYVPTVAGLGPHYIIAAEYDTLRDGAVEYMLRLLRAGVHVDFQLAATTCHCFTKMPHPYTSLTYEMMAYAFRREFGMLK